MKYLIETPYGCSLFSRRVFTPGWWGDVPYLICSMPYKDNINRQHLDLRISKTACDEDIQGNLIAKTHVPSGYVMISNEEYEFLQKAKKLFK